MRIVLLLFFISTSARVLWFSIAPTALARRVRTRSHVNVYFYCLSKRARFWFCACYFSLRCRVQFRIGYCLQWLPQSNIRDLGRFDVSAARYEKRKNEFAFTNTDANYNSHLRRHSNFNRRRLATLLFRRARLGHTASRSLFTQLLVGRGECTLQKAKVNNKKVWPCFYHNLHFSRTEVFLFLHSNTTTHEISSKVVLSLSHWWKTRKYTCGCDIWPPLFIQCN